MRRYATQANLPMHPSPHQTPHTSLAERIGLEAIGHVVDSFYDAVQLHPTLKVPFTGVQNWPHHKGAITHFWWIVLGGKPYQNHRYDPVGKHDAAGFSEALLQDWKVLFWQTIQRYVAPPLDSAWFEKVEMIGDSLLGKQKRLLKEQTELSQRQSEQ